MHLPPLQGLGVEQCTVVAHDWGGPIAWNFAALYPQMVHFSLFLYVLGVKPDNLQLSPPDCPEEQPEVQLEADPQVLVHPLLPGR